MNIKPEVYYINNFTILLLKTSENIIYVSSQINNGFISESKKTSGINHLLEHILFDAWEKCKNKKCKYYWLNKPVVYNGYTSKTNIKYYIYGLNNYIEELLDYIISITVNPKFYNGILEKNKEIVLNELYNYINDPNYKLYDVISKNLYKNVGLQYYNDYKQQIENLKSINMDTIIKFYKKYYTSSNIIFTVSGNFNKEYILNIFKSRLPNIKTNINVINNYFVYKKKLIFVKNNNSKNTNFNICFPINIFQNDKKLLYLKIAIKMLNEKLTLYLRTKYKLIYSITVNLNIYNFGSVVNIDGSCLDKNILSVLKIIIYCIKFIQTNNIDNNLLESIKKKYLLNYYITKYSAISLSDFYENQYINQINNKTKIIFSPEEIINIIKSSSNINIHEAINLLNFNHMLCVYIGKNSYNISMNNIMTF